MGVKDDKAGQHEEKIDSEKSLFQDGHQPTGDGLDKGTGAKTGVACRNSDRGQASAYLQQQQAIPPIGCHRIGDGDRSRRLCSPRRDFNVVHLWMEFKRADGLT
jgi:hypothetical protein